MLHADANTPPHLCGECLSSPPPWDGFAFHGAYSGRLKELILGWKFGRALHGDALLGRLGAEALDLRGLERSGVVAPVPLHPRRLAWRGYNHSLELARRVARHSGSEVTPQALTRLRDTVPQARLDAKKRKSNLKGAFSADAGQVAGHRVLLVDDVMTTGATLVECTHALHQAGATGVDVLVLARA